MDTNRIINRGENPHFSMRVLIIGIGLLFLLSNVSLVWGADSSEAFPLRSQYHDLRIIETEDLAHNFDQYTIVDVRSQYEYTILHIEGAVLVPVTDLRFAQKAKELLDATGKPLVFYCNGITCRKSYKAGRLAKNSGLTNVMVYDAGIYNWGRAEPNKTILLDDTLKDPEKLISKERFNEHLLSPEEFSDRVTKAVVVDVRSALTRAGMGLFVGREHAVPLDKRSRLDKYISKAAEEGKPLLIYDATGRQVRWLQYYLEHVGVSEYYFMRGGAKGFFDFYRKQ